MLSKTEIKFISELNISNGYKNTISKALQKVRNKKYYNNRELFNLTSEEFTEGLLLSLSDISKKSIDIYISVYKKYFDWIKENSIIEFNYNYEESLKNIKEQLVKNIAFEVLSRKEVYEHANSCESAQEGIIITLVFEGVKGERGSKYSEIMNIKYDDLINTTLKTELRSLELPKDIIPIYIKACNQRNSKNINGDIVPLNESGYLIKEIVKSKMFTDRNNSGFISRELGHYKYNNQKMNGNILRLSGECFYLSVIEDLKGELTDDDYLKVLNRYKGGIGDTALFDLKNSYIKYKNSEKYEKVNTEFYYNVYSQILGENSQIDKISWSDKEIGEIGEKYFLEKLIEFYGKSNVLDETKNGVGYDFSANNRGTKLLYEVKSTKSDANILTFYMTIKELKMSNIFKEHYKLSILFFKGDKILSSYIIPNPIKFLYIEEQAKVLLNLETEGICVPLEIKITTSINKIKRFKCKL